MTEQDYGKGECRVGDRALCPGFLITALVTFGKSLQNLQDLLSLLQHEEVKLTKQMVYTNQ